MCRTYRHKASGRQKWEKKYVDASSLHKKVTLEVQVLNDELDSQPSTQVIREYSRAKVRLRIVQGHLKVAKDTLCQLDHHTELLGD